MKRNIIFIIFSLLFSISVFSEAQPLVFSKKYNTKIDSISKLYDLFDAETPWKRDEIKISDRTFTIKNQLPPLATKFKPTFIEY